MNESLFWDLNLKSDTRALWAVGLPSSLLCYLSWNFAAFVGETKSPSDGVKLIEYPRPKCHEAQLPVTSF